MGQNLKTPLHDFKRKWEESFKINIDNRADYQKKKFKEGWIPLACEPYSPALRRFKGENKLSREIVRILETQGIFDFNIEYVEDLEEALDEITLGSFSHTDIADAIADYGTNSFMLSRKAFYRNGSEISNNIQWYVKRPGH